MSPADVDHLDDAAVIAALQAGDDDAYERVVRAYAGRMLAVARRMLPTDEEAQDAVQDALLSAFRSINRFKGDSRLSTWLHRIVVNAALMRLRTKRRRPEASIEDLLPVFNEKGYFTDHSHSWRVGTDHERVDDDTRRIVYDAMAQLPDDYRNVLLLRDIEELSTREAAEVLGASEGAVKIRLHRARLALRELLDPHFSGDRRS